MAIYKPKPGGGPGPRPPVKPSSKATKSVAGYPKKPTKSIMPKKPNAGFKMKRGM